eukprot:2491387-Pleurochrysis_carterae.AAC.2
MIPPSARTRARERAMCTIASCNAQAAHRWVKMPVYAHARVPHARSIARARPIHHMRSAALSSAY